jgi:3-hydroxyisobutyrate dehydrogenase-like beta-hydroxyacid dehydrogenase
MAPSEPGSGRPTERFALVGFGALGQAFAEGLRRGDAAEVRVFARDRPDPDAARALRERLRAAGVRTCSSIEEAVGDADAVVAAVPAGAAAAVAAACAPRLPAGCVYVDPAPLHPAEKARLAALVGDAGGRYADVAVLGTVAVSGAAVRCLAAGPGASRWRELVAPRGFDVTAIDGPAGRASLVKLLRSVYMKGRDALILEMLLAARRHGVDHVVLHSIGGPGEQVPFPELARRVVTSLAVYAERRATELGAAAELVAEVDLEPLMADAGAARLRWLAEVAPREHFGGERPADLDAVLAAVEALDAARTPRASGD